MPSLVFLEENVRKLPTTVYISSWMTCRYLKIFNALLAICSCSGSIKRTPKLKIKILGLSAFYHDSAAALVVDDKILAAAQEERFTRIKHDESFPTNAVQYCLKEANCKLDEIDHVVFYEKPFLKFDRLLETYLSFAPSGFGSFVRAMPQWLKQKLHLPREIKKGLPGEWKKPLVFTKHHESHAASAFFPSPFEEAAILTMDGVGEWDAATVGVGNGNQMKLIKFLIDTTITWLTLPLFYFLVFTPFALLLRAIGKADMKHPNKNLPSYWKNTDQPTSPKQYLRQF